MKRKVFLSLTIAVLILIFLPSMPAQSEERAVDLAHALRERGISPLLITGLISMIPIFELRGGIPVGIALFKLNTFAVYGTCVGFNLIPVLPILILLNPMMRRLQRIPLFQRLFHGLTRATEKRRRLVERYKEFGLTLFVGVPLPVTGAWTGSLIAAVMALKVAKSFLFITLGVVLAGVIVTLLTVLGVYGIVLALTILLTFLVLYIVRMRRGLRKIREVQ